MDRTEFLLTVVLVLFVFVGAFFNAYRVQKSDFLPVVVEEQSGTEAEPNGRAQNGTGSSHSSDLDSALQTEERKRDINTATVEELMSVGGIGDSLASQIAKYRNMNGLFHSMTDLDKLPGIGKKRVELLSQYFEVKGALPLPDVQQTDFAPASQPQTGQPLPQTNVEFSPGVLPQARPFSYVPPQRAVGETRVVNINSATWAEIESLPEIGEVLALRIIEERVRNGPFFRKEDIVRVHGIGEKTFQRIEPFITVGY